MKLFLSVILCCTALAGRSQDFSAYQYGLFQGKDAGLLYRILYPGHFDTTHAYPLIVFLHGALARGNDNESQLLVAGAFFLKEENRKKFPAIVIFPQCPGYTVWADFSTEIDSTTGQAKKWHFPFHKKPSEPVELLKGLLDSLCSKRFVNARQVYIGGLSQGGMGVFDMAARYPDLFAAAFPICGAGPVSTAKKFAGKMSMWIFHGDRDDVVPVRFSRDYFNRLKKLGSDVRYTEYPGVYHDSWNNAFAEPELMSWLFSKSKN